MLEIRSENPRNFHSPPLRSVTICFLTASPFIRAPSRRKIRSHSHRYFIIVVVMTQENITSIVAA